MHYAPTADGAFNSVNQLIMRDVNAGWLLRYAHMNGASFFFIVTYIHIFRGLYYGSYKAPRELVWMLGLVIYLLMMATAFMGYVLPWGQMSYLGRAGHHRLLLGASRSSASRSASGCSAAMRRTRPRSTRFFSLHYLLPFVIAAVVILHIWALHIPGSSNPTGVDVKDEQDTLPFHPFYTAKDGWFAGVVPARSIAVVTYLRAELSRAPGQLHSGQPARDAGAHRARMVFLAVLRDPALPSPSTSSWTGEAVGRAGDVRLDPAAVLPAVARPLAGPLGQLSAGVQALLLAAGRRRPDPRLCRRRAARRCRTCARPDRGGLLLPPLPGDPAARLGVRDAAAAAELDHANPCFTARKPKRLRPAAGRGAARPPRPWSSKGAGRHMRSILGSRRRWSSPASC